MKVSVTAVDPLDYLRARGFSETTILAAGWRVEPLGKRARRYGLPATAEAELVWVIPYPARSGRPEFERIRILDPESEHHRRGKYRQPAAVALDLFDLWGHLERATPADAGLLVEGEANAAAALEFEPGLPVVGLPGQRSLRADLASRLARFPAMYVWLDTGEGFERAAAEIDARLRAAGVEDVRFLDSAGVDANDALLLLGHKGGARVLGQMLDQAAPLGAGEGAALLDDLVAFVRRYVVMTPSQSAVIALWIVHAEALEAAETTPYLAITSAEKRSGKTRLLEILAGLVRRPLATSNISDAALFRAVAAGAPTLLFDEVDAVFGPKARDREDLRSLLNAGYRRGAEVWRCVGDGSKQKVESFPVFCAKALAGIGELPDTVADRAFPVRLERRAPGETVERYRRRDVEPEATALRERVERFARQGLETLRAARPDLPEQLDDRGQDAAEPLLAVADLAGRGWPERARAAIVELRGERPADAESIGLRLLSDVRSAFDRRGTERLSSADVLEALHGLEEAPWGEWYGRPLTARGLAKLLTPYRIRTRTIRLDDGSDGTAKGFLREQFEHAWSRYLPPYRTQRHNLGAESDCGLSASVTTPPLCRIANGSDLAREADCAAVSDRSADAGAEAA